MHWYIRILSQSLSCVYGAWLCGSVKPADNDVIYIRAQAWRETPLATQAWKKKQWNFLKHSSWKITLGLENFQALRNADAIV